MVVSFGTSMNKAAMNIYIKVLIFVWTYIFLSYEMPKWDFYRAWFLDSLINREVDERPDKKFGQGFNGPQAAAGGNKNK